LYRKGIDRYTFQDAWEEVAGEENPDESQLILRLVKKKCGDKKELDQKEYRRLQGYLARRGFSWEKVNAVLNEAEITLVRD
jgi:regulatory protein